MHTRWSLIPLLLALQACSGTPFGQKLADSFDSPSLPPESQTTTRTDSTRTDAAEPNKALSPSNLAEEKLPTSDSEDEAAEEQTAENQSTQDTKTEDNTPEDATIRTESSTPESTPTVASSAPAESTKPRPYRITIRLVAADPAAPAEGVTDVLRRAGIGFEVETIEKISSRTPIEPFGNDSTGQP